MPQNLLPLANRNKKLSLQGIIINYISRFRGLINTYVIKNTENDIKELNELCYGISKDIINVYKNVIELLFSHNKYLNYNKPSMDKVNNELLSDLNNELDTSDTKIKYPIKSNVAIAAAITAYGRIFMIKFKKLKNNLYLGGDTDYILEKPLDNNWLGSE